MESKKSYDKAPIREAVFDVRLKFEKKPEAAIFEEIFLDIKEAYPKKEVINSQTVMFAVKPGEEPIINASKGTNGLKLTSVDGTRILQIRPDGFSLSQLKPYLGWEKFIEEAKKLFGVYLSKTQPKSAERIALRYINVIEINKTNFPLEEYFLTNPKIAEELPQEMVQFFYRVMIKDDATENTFAIINQTADNGKKPDQTTIIFDIDVFQPNLNLNPSDEVFWRHIGELKKFRTRIFEDSLTQKTKDLFN